MSNTAKPTNDPPMIVAKFNVNIKTLLQNRSYAMQALPLFYLGNLATDTQIIFYAQTFLCLD
jgi:hypothetical protein